MAKAWPFWLIAHAAPRLGFPVRQRTEPEAVHLQYRSCRRVVRTHRRNPTSLEIVMNRTLAIALSLSFAAVGNALADDITVDPHPFVSTASRAQVQDELRQFRQAGINPWADEYNPIAGFRSSMTRAEVTAEFMASRQAVAAMSAEDSGSSYLARANVPHRTSVLARAD
jgi:hypothetical protein